jgi:hypothetical protein
MSFCYFIFSFSHFKEIISLTEKSVPLISAADAQLLEAGAPEIGISGNSDAPKLAFS